MVLNLGVLSSQLGGGKGTVLGEGEETWSDVGVSGGKGEVGSRLERTGATNGGGVEEKGIRIVEEAEDVEGDWFGQKGFESGVQGFCGGDVEGEKVGELGEEVWGAVGYVGGGGR